MDPRAMIQTMIALASASLGLVAALAWNEAMVATLFAVLVLVWLGKIASRIGGQAAFEREAEG
jgi:uncharacterized membrane protein YhiD involved in acid resistance